MPIAADPFLYGAGGGFSSVFARPSYQNGVVHRRIAVGRAFPDVALDADPTTGMLVGETQVFPNGVSYDEYRIGGTSLASPLMAGMVADAAQHAQGRLGFLNIGHLQAGGGPHRRVHRRHAGHPARTSARTSQTAWTAANGYLYSVRTFDQDSSLFTRPRLGRRDRRRHAELGLPDRLRQRRRVT